MDWNAICDIGYLADIVVANFDRWQSYLMPNTHTAT